LVEFDRAIAKASRRQCYQPSGKPLVSGRYNHPMLWVGQFGMENGEAKQITPWVGLFPGENGAPEGKTDLYVIVEPASPGSEDFCADLKEAIGDLFHKEKASLTGGVLGSPRSAYENLRD